jgi:hypothetical protein
MDGGLPARAFPVSLEELEAQITELAGHLNAAQYRWLTLIAEFDRRHGWSDGRLASCAHWLNFKCGLNLGAAREKVRVAHALRTLPRIAAAMARGELSYSKVRALSRVACAATEESLLMIALHGTAHHVETNVRHYRRAQQAEQLSREAHQQAHRSLHYWYDDDGSLVIKARLPALGGAMVVKALEAAMQAMPATELCMELDEEQPLSFEERRADALAMLGESYLQRRTASSSSADRYQVVVHVDAETLKEHTAGRCHIEQGPSLPAETVRRIACDSSRVRILESEHGAPLDVGRKNRSIPPAIRRALNARDAGCRFPGCTYQRYVDAHHVEHWADGGETKLSNLVTLCRWHHRLVHEGDIAVAPRASGGWRFLKPDGQEFDLIHPAATAHWRDLQHAHEAQGIRINRRTAATRWRGERIDYELGVWGLCHQAERARERRGAHRSNDVSAETSASAEMSARPGAASTD